MTYKVAAIDSRNIGKVQSCSDELAARKLAKQWRKDSALRNVQVISRDEYGRGRIEA